PDAAGDTAVLGPTITAARTITIPNGVDITVGSLQINDNISYSIAAAGTGRLRFNNGASNAVLPVLSGAPAISAPITLDSTLQVTNQSAGILDLSGTISQPIAFPPLQATPRGLIKDGAGAVRLSGSASNAYLG